MSELTRALANSELVAIRMAKKADSPEGVATFTAAASNYALAREVARLGEIIEAAVKP